MRGPVSVYRLWIPGAHRVPHTAPAAGQHRACRAAGTRPAVRALQKRGVVELTRTRSTPAVGGAMCRVARARTFARSALRVDGEINYNEK